MLTGWFGIRISRLRFPADGKEATMRQSNRAEAQVSTRVDPKLVMSSTLLQMTCQELDQAVETELNENPALERIEEEEVPLDDDSIADQILSRKGVSYRFTHDVCSNRPYDPEGQPDWTEFVVAPVPLCDHLRAQLYAILPEHLQVLGGNVVDAIDDRGYLEMEVEELALTFSASMEDVEQVLAALRQCEPAGVGARNLQECLEIQLRQTVESPVRDLAIRVVVEGWEEFSKQRIQKLSRRFRAKPAMIQEAADLIASLNPFPGEDFRADWEINSSSPPQSVVPDVVIQRSEAGYDVEIRGFDPSMLSVNSHYKQMYREGAKLDEDVRKHVTQYVDRAGNFIGSLQQRRRTLQLIVDHLLKTQQGFIATGSYRFLRPMTRMQLAKAVGVHESTVSRATMNKFVQLPSQEVVPFEVFFKPALRVQKAIEEILLHENPSRPLSDERISQMLKQQGIRVARRTINKYREQLNILSSRRRRA
jgi:RNA polymerase sigma-54 factor